MKRFLILLSLLFCNVVFADTINLHWLNDDGTTYENSTCVIDSDLILPSTPPTKYGYTFTGWKMSNYIPIEYLESTGTQWIDTGIFADYGDNIKLDIVVQYTSVSKQQQFFGIYAGAYFGISESYFVNGGNRMYTADTKAHRFVFNTNILNASNVNLSIDSVQDTYSRKVESGKIFLFSTSTYPSNYTCFAKLYSAKIEHNNNLVRDFIPTLDNTGTPCMFDKVEGKIYYNQGTGQFIAGPVLQ